MLLSYRVVSGSAFLRVAPRNGGREINFKFNHEGFSLGRREM